MRLKSLVQLLRGYLVKVDDQLLLEVIQVSPPLLRGLPPRLHIAIEQRQNCWRALVNYHCNVCVCVYNYYIIKYTERLWNSATLSRAYIQRANIIEEIILYNKSLIPLENSVIAARAIEPSERLYAYLSHWCLKKKQRVSQRRRLRRRLDGQLMN